MYPDRNPAPEVDSCRNCGDPAFLHLIDAHDFDTGNEQFSLEQCPTCKLVHTFPILNESQLSKYYKNDYYGKGNKKFSTLIEKWTIFSNRKLARSIIRNFNYRQSSDNSKASILDIGCGRGNLLKAFNDMGFECHGVERAEFPDQTYDEGIAIHKTSLQEVKFKDNYFDIIVLWHVLEHLSNPAEVIRETSRILRPQGILVIAVPNFGSFQSRLFGKHWFHLDLPRHLYHFEKSSLENLLTKNGFKTTTFDTRAIDQSVFGFIQSALNSTSWFPPNSFYEQLKLPWQNRKLSFYLQAALATILLPLSLVDYFISGFSHEGSCLILTSVKPGKNATEQG